LLFWFLLNTLFKQIFAMKEVQHKEQASGGFMRKSRGRRKEKRVLSRSKEGIILHMLCHIASDDHMHQINHKLLDLAGRLPEDLWWF
jgi:hypothetical protein